MDLRWIAFFVTFTNNNDGTERSTSPGYSAAGEYTFNVILDDGYGAWTNQQIYLNVGDQDPEETLQFNFRSQSAPVALWNTINIVPPATLTHAQILNTKNAPSPVTHKYSKSELLPHRYRDLRQVIIPVFSLTW